MQSRYNHYMVRNDDREPMNTNIVPQTENTPSKILMAGLSMLPPDSAFKEHSHPYYQLTHVVTGKYRYSIAECEYEVGVGDTVFLPTNIAHSITNTESETGYYFEVKFFSFSKNLTEICENIELITHNDTFSRRMLEEIFDENNNRTSLSEDVMLTYLNTILYKLSAENRRETLAPSKYIDVSPYSGHVRQVIRFLEDNYMRQLSLDDIAASTAINKSHLCNLFKKETGVTVFECLMIIRVRKAVELLTYTELSLSQISKDTGFTNITHFNRVYTKHVMIPPGQFRKHLKSQDYYWREAILNNDSNPIAAATLENRKIDFQQR